MPGELVWLNLYGREAVRHKLKSGKKCIFCVLRLFLSLWRTASRPYRLSHNNALCINQLYKPKDKSMQFSWKILRIGRSGKWDFFESAILNNLKKNVFLTILLSMKTCSLFKRGIIYFCTMNSLLRILEKTSSELICTQLYRTQDKFWHSIKRSWI